VNCHAVMPKTRSGDSATTLAVRGDLDAGRPVGDHKEPDAAFAFSDDGVAGVEPALLRCVGDRLELAVGQVVKKGHTAHDLDSLVGHS